MERKKKKLKDVEKCELGGAMTTKDMALGDLII